MSTTRRRVRIPTEEEIRARLSVLAREANTLRALLRVVRRTNPTKREPAVQHAR